MLSGVVVIAVPRSLPLLDPSKIPECAANDRLLLLLDGVRNPHNLGTIARTAAPFGVPRIVISIILHKQPPWIPAIALQKEDWSTWSFIVRATSRTFAAFA